MSSKKSKKEQSTTLEFWWKKINEGCTNTVLVLKDAVDKLVQGETPRDALLNSLSLNELIWSGMYFTFMMRNKDKEIKELKQVILDKEYNQETEWINIKKSPYWGEIEKLNFEELKGEVLQYRCCIKELEKLQKELRSKIDYEEKNKNKDKVKELSEIATMWKSACLKNHEQLNSIRHIISYELPPSKNEQPVTEEAAKDILSKICQALVDPDAIKYFARVLSNDLTSPNIEDT